MTKRKPTTLAEDMERDLTTLAAQVRELYEVMARATWSTAEGWRRAYVGGVIDAAASMLERAAITAGVYLHDDA